MLGLSGAASVIAVVEILGKLFDICRTYSTSVKNARKDITRLRNEITALELVLTNVADIEDSGVSGQLETLSLLKSPGEALERCQDELNRLIKPVDPGDGVQRMRKYGLGVLKWPLANKDVDKAVTMERYKSLFSLALTGDHMALSMMITRSLGDLSQRLEDVHAVIANTGKDTTAVKFDVAATRVDSLAIRTKVDEIASTRTRQVKEKLSQDIIIWLWTSDTSANYHAACKIRRPETGKWLLESSQFKGWEKSKGKLMWLHGIPGCGKTIMTSTIIDHLTNAKDFKRSALAYFGIHGANSSKLFQIFANYLTKTRRN